MTMRGTTALLTTAALLGWASAAGAVTGHARDGLRAMQGLNVLVLQNLNVGGGEIEGKAYVGGDLTGNSFQIGFGNSTYGTTTSTRSTLTVGGNLTAGINLTNGPNGGNGQLGSYGAYVVGNVTQKLNLQSNAAAVRVGGNLKDIQYSNGTSLSVVGNTIDTIGLGDNSVTNIGGTASGFNSGNNNVVLNVSGSVGNLGIGTGNVRIGGSLGNTSGGNNMNISVVGAIGGGSLGSNTVVKAIGNVNVNGTGGDTIYTAGSFNGNANGATINQHYAYNATVTAPTAPAAPVVAALTGTTAQLKADIEALSTALGILTTTNFVTGAPGNANQVTFSVANTDPNTAAVFNLGYSQFEAAQQFQYSFASLNKPVVVNILGSNNGTVNWNATSANLNGDTLQAYSRNIIWNFLDATQVNINREVYGSVLAAKATIAASSNINGSVVAKIFNQSAEVHLGTYARSVTFIPDYVGNVPEPATWVQFIFGFGVLGVTMRRRKAIVAA